jgi:hypothetical protein
MENTVIQGTLNGSPILAYGSAGSTKNRKISIIISIIILLITIPILTIVGYFFLGSAELPSETLLAISVIPSDVNSKMNGALITELPAPWRTALEMNISFPIILGLALTSDGKPAPYAVLPRIASVAAPEKTNIISGTLTKMILNENIKTSKSHYRSYSKLLSVRKNMDAGWMINERLLLMISGEALSDARDDIPVYGSIKANRGVIFLPIEDVVAKEANGKLFAILGEALGTSSEAVTNRLLTQGIDIRDVHAPESLVMGDNGSIQLTWKDLRPEESPQLLIASGKTTSTTFQLPDDMAVKLISSDATSTTNEIYIAGTIENVTSTQQSSCPGHIRFSIQGEALQNLLTLIKMPLSWKEKIQAVTISTDNNKNIFCINE